MSQQGPGGYGGGGPYGPPGGGGYGGPPPGGGGYPPPGGAPPGGYGPPAGSPPGYGGPPGGAPPGYGPPQPGYGGYPGSPPGGPPVPPAKKSKALLFVGLGCGGLILLSIAGSVAFYFYMKSKVSDAETAIANLAASGAAVGAPTPGTTDTATAPILSAACAKAAACCTAIATKTSPASAALAAQGCARTYASFADAMCAQQHANLKRAAATMGATCE